MAEQPNLELDVDGPGPTLRVAVADVQGYTRQGVPIISVGCDTRHALEREIKRLKAELDAVSDRARSVFEGKRPEASPHPDASSAAAAPAEKPHLDASLCVADVMTRDVKTVRRNERISIAQELLNAGRFRHVIVLDDHDDRVAGVVSHRDIVFGALAWTLGQGRAAHDKALDSYPVKDVMATNVVTIDSGAPLGDAATTMRTHQLGCLPVVDADELVGVITEADFLYLLTS